MYVTVLGDSFRCAKTGIDKKKLRLKLDIQLVSKPSCSFKFIVNSSSILFLFLDTIIQESESGNPCHDGTEAEAPTGAYTCNPNASICLG